jgi:manganese oxidase
MMTGFGQFGPMEMGGMFTVVKVREGLAANDYKDPGWYKHPAGTVAYQIDNPAAPAPRQTGAARPTSPNSNVNVVKPPKNHKGH